MTRYIDADALKQNTYYSKEIYQAIDDAPTVDAVPVKRGQWLKGDYKTVSGKCSVCGWVAIYYETDVCGMPYCPNCGAYMEGDE